MNKPVDYGKGKTEFPIPPFLGRKLPPEMEKMLAEAINPQTTNNALEIRSSQKTAPRRKIMNPEGFTKAEVAAASAIYDALVTDPDIRGKHPLDISLIVKKGYPVFEATIGTKSWKKLKRYYGIGCESDKNCLDAEALKGYLFKLRTIENACVYISGYWETLENLYGLLNEFAPSTGVSERQQIITGAKLVFFALELICGDWFPQKYFFHDAKAEKLNGPRKRSGYDVARPEVLYHWLPDYNMCNFPDNCRRPYGPEQVLEVYRRFEEYGPSSLITDMLMDELLRLQERGLLDQVMAFCELSYRTNGKEWDIVSNNIPNPYDTFEKVMELKKRIHPNRTAKAPESFLFIQNVRSFSLAYLWRCYVVLLEAMNSKAVLDKFFDTANMAYQYCGDKADRITAYRWSKDKMDPVLVSGHEEILRYVRFIEYLVEKNIQLPYWGNNKLDCAPTGQVFLAIELGQKLGCTQAFSTAGGAIQMAKELLKKDETGFLSDIHGKRCMGKEEDPDIPHIIKAFGITPDDLVRWGGNPAVIFPDPVENAVTNVLRENTADTAVPEEGLTVVEDVIKGIPAEVAAEEYPDADEVPTVEGAVEECPDMPNKELWAEARNTDWSNPSAVMEWLIKWAKQCHYEVQDDEAQHKLILKVLVEGNTEPIRAFAMKEIDESTFMNKIGLAPNYAYMCFSIENINCEELAAHILTSIRKKNVPVCSIRLYKYLISEKIKCGLERARMKKNQTIEKYLSRM